MATKKSKRPTVTVKDFVGAQMSNFLYALTCDARIPHTYAAKAKALQAQWDSVATFQLNNPLVAVELSEKFFPTRPR